MTNNHVYKLTVWNEEFLLRLFRSSYSFGDNLAIVARTTQGEPFATLTVNFGDEIPDKTRAYIDTNNCPWAEEFLVENSIAKPVKGCYHISGYCLYPLYEFDLTKVDTLY